MLFLIPHLSHHCAIQILQLVGPHPSRCIPPSCLLTPLQPRPPNRIPAMAQSHRIRISSLFLPRPSLGHASAHLPCLVVFLGPCCTCWRGVLRPSSVIRFLHHTFIQRVKHEFQAHTSHPLGCVRNAWPTHHISPIIQGQGQPPSPATVRASMFSARLLSISCFIR